MTALKAMLHGAFGLDVEARGKEWVVVDPKRRKPES
jgi:hypothetical protein